MNILTNEEYERIEQYLAQMLTTQERLEFEQRLQNNPHLAREVANQQKMLESMRLYGKRNRLKAQMNVFHKELEEEGLAKPMMVSRYGMRVFWKKMLPTMGVAASVAVLTVISTLFILDYMRSLETRQTTFYQELKREVYHIKKTQNDISKAVSQTNSEIKPVGYSATGFVIATNGYLITNYHVVKDADSVFIESVTDTLHQYKVKVVYKRADVDLALLKIDDPNFIWFNRLPYAVRTKEADLGEPVYTLAFPRDDMVYGEGSVSSHTGLDGDTSAYQVSIPVNPGNSGGPLWDERGNLIGIIKGKHTAEVGAAFAIKSKHLLTLIQSIPSDSLPEPLVIPRKNYVKDLRRPDQIKQLEGLVFKVRVNK
jgi:S1-C subfamily serine protease